MSTFSKSRQFQIERLEDRQMMAADVTASLSNGTLSIHAAEGQNGAAQAVQVAQLPNGKIRVTGLTSPANPAGSLVNGVGVVEFARPLKIQVNLGGGPDTVQLVGASNNGTFINYQVNTGGLNLGAGGENDVVSVLNFGNGSLDVRTGVGQDLVRIQNSNFTALTIDSGSGADTIEIGPPPGNVGVVSVDSDLNIFADSFTNADNENGSDTVKLQDVVTGRDLIINLRGGNDTLDMTAVTSRRHMSLHGEKGNDTMTLTQVNVWENFFALMGEGNDALNLIGLRTRGLTAHGGDGFDRLVRYDDHNSNPTLSGWEEINGRLTPAGRLFNLGNAALPTLSLS